jgi:hypothetical protein
MGKEVGEGETVVKIIISRGWHGETLAGSGIGSCRVVAKVRP